MKKYKDIGVYDFSDSAPAYSASNYDAYANYMSMQGRAKDEGDPNKYKDYNVLGSGKIKLTVIKEDTKTTSLDIEEYLIPENTLNRQCKDVKAIKAIVIHWTEAPKQDPKVTIDYWSSENRIGNAHFVIGIDGKIYQAIPENEQARHAGNNEGIYKNKATELFGDGINPNVYSLGIEMEPLTSNGDFSPETYSSAVNLASSLCNKYSLNPETSLIRHYDVTGKNCPKYFVNYENEWRLFKENVIKAIGEQ